MIHQSTHFEQYVNYSKYTNVMNNNEFTWTKKRKINYSNEWIFIWYTQLSDVSNIPRATIIHG